MDGSIEQDAADGDETLMAEMQKLLDFVRDGDVSLEEIEKEFDNLNVEDLKIPATISVESTMTEINQLTSQLYVLHNKNKRDPIPMAKIISLLELKAKLTGMMNVKPDVQAIIDSEINAYKKRFIILAKEIFDAIQLERLVSKLSAEGL